MTLDEISVLAELVRRRSGVVIDRDKTYLIETRLAPVARREGFTTISELIGELQARRNETLMWAVAKARSAPVRIWSLGCSTGQEPYSLAMLVEEERGHYPGLKVEIFGGDLSERCLEKASSGLYTQLEVQRGLPARLLVKYFDKIDDAWVLSPRIRQALFFHPSSRRQAA